MNYTASYRRVIVGMIFVGCAMIVLLQKAEPAVMAGDMIGLAWTLIGLAAVMIGIVIATKDVADSS